MESDASYSGGDYQDNHSTSGLLRFRSAPGSLFANLSERTGGCGGGVPPTEVVQDENRGVMNGYVGVNSQLPPQYPRPTGRVVSSVEMEMDRHPGRPKLSPGLTRQSSSPAGLFSHLTSPNDYATTRTIGSYRMGNGVPGDLKGQLSYPSGLSTSVGFLSRISEVENENGGATGADHEKLGTENGEAQLFGSGYPFGSWNDTTNFVESLAGLKREVDSDVKSFGSSQKAEQRNRPPVLSHHLSLPKTPAEMAAMEKLLHFQDAVPCKIRAKRGCATHPRSIAERVRRTRISERMRKLQDLVPNMDKQTNTADMLDLAVEYIKDLQKQHKTLADTRAKCRCSAMMKPVLDYNS